MKLPLDPLQDVDGEQFARALATPEDLDSLIGRYQEELRKFRKRMIALSVLGAVLIAFSLLISNRTPRYKIPHVFEAESPIEAVSILERRLRAAENSNIFRNPERLLPILFFIVIMFSLKNTQSQLDSRLATLLVYRAIQQNAETPVKGVD